ncbi:hypothetical protein FACS1894167_04720 [Synergistales bacterium]|nr:hypothetical protein FACS1894167_04720 [Synergistales bacterium]
MLREIAKALDVNYRSIYEPTLYAAEDLMYTLFELDEHYGLSIPDFDGKECIAFNRKILDDFISGWQQHKKDLTDETISKAEYMEWKLNWPQTADDLGKHEPPKQWRKPPETTD